MYATYSVRSTRATMAIPRAPITTHEPGEVTHGYRMVRALPALQNRDLVPARRHRKHDDAALSRVPSAGHRHPSDASDGGSSASIDRMEIGRRAEVTASIRR